MNAAASLRSLKPQLSLKFRGTYVGICTQKKEPHTNAIEYISHHVCFVAAP